MDMRGPYAAILNIGPDGRADLFTSPTEIANGFSLSDLLDTALIEHVRSVLLSVVWNPAREKDKPVRSEIELTILYRGERAYIMYDHNKNLYWKPVDWIRKAPLIR